MRQLFKSEVAGWVWDPLSHSPLTLPTLGSPSAVLSLAEGISLPRKAVMTQRARLTEVVFIANSTTRLHQSFCAAHGKKVE